MKIKITKNLIVYGILIVLCVAAVVGYFAKNTNKTIDSSTISQGTRKNLQSKTPKTTTKQSTTDNKGRNASTKTGDENTTVATAENLQEKTGDTASNTSGPDMSAQAGNGTEAGNTEPGVQSTPGSRITTEGAENTPVDKTFELNNESTENEPSIIPVMDRSGEEKQRHIAELMKKAVEQPEPNPVVGIGRGEDYFSVTETALENAGGLRGIIKKGCVVLIKPNICTLSEAGSPHITDYRVVQKVTDMVREYGASRVIVGEGTISGNAFSPAFLKLNKYDAIDGVELVNFNDMNKEDCYELKPEKSYTGKALFIPKIYMDADVVINIAKLKTHSTPGATVSLTLKNAIGIPSERIYGGPGYKIGVHNLGLIGAIIDLNRIRKPDMCIIEGIVGGEGDGPLRNKPVKSNIIFAGKDLVALDTVGLTFMGFNIEQCPHVQEASNENLGISDLAKINIIGADLNSIKMDFKSPFKR